MPDTIALLAKGACPLAPTDVFTAAATTSVLAIDISNPTGLLQNTTVLLGGNILFAVPMPANGGLSWHGPQVLNAGDKVNIVADSASCEYHVSGVVIT